MRKMLKNKKGFTLIELILVIAIIAILATVALPKLSTFQDKAKASRDEANIKLLNNLSQIYYADNGAYYSYDVNPSTTYAQFVEAMETATYISTKESDNLQNVNNWVNKTLPTYTEGTGLIAK